MFLFDLLAHINDDHDWTFGAIARWLEWLEEPGNEEKEANVHL